MTDKERARVAAEAKFKKMESRRTEGAAAMTEYEAAAQSTQKKTERLKAMRLARDAALSQDRS